MVLSRMDLRQYPADSGPVVSENDEQVVDLQTHLRQLVDDLHVRQSLLICADLVLALDD